MSSATTYVLLITSLPHLGLPFAARQTPISRIRLERRLRVLEPEDAKILARIEDLLWWDRVQRAASDAEVVAAARRLVAELERPALRRIVRDRMELRTLVAALRRRWRGEAAPPVDGDWGFGRWTRRIARNWREPAFGLERTFPWVIEAQRLLEEGDSLGLERLLLAEVWTQLGRLGAGHYFDLEAVVVYVLRWQVIDRWTRYDAAKATDRFGALVERGLGAHTEGWLGREANGGAAPG